MGGVVQTGEAQIARLDAGELPIIPAVPGFLAGIGNHGPCLAIQGGFDYVKVNAPGPVPVENAHAVEDHGFLEVERDPARRILVPDGMGVVAVLVVNAVDQLFRPGGQV